MWPNSSSPGGRRRQPFQHECFDCRSARQQPASREFHLLEPSGPKPYGRAGRAEAQCGLPPRGELDVGRSAVFLEFVLELSLSVVFCPRASVTVSLPLTFHTPFPNSKRLPILTPPLFQRITTFTSMAEPSATSLSGAIIPTRRCPTSHTPMLSTRAGSLARAPRRP